ncbi:phosphatidylglycerol lysyltransferase domain-containing protein [Endomicrobium proavitum]|uniref:Lysophosphatidylglycerol synthetase n=1 Tax=Endomicrobium proavitum TaxID=1408281 RepID=A0A0G3WL70_9BACT|nr:phosphatidylglycerol lysyltransferase domain-containing protein [Endomicrobium proavitum]AKL98249.1 Lysophosphatidylglycerol synthetase [Endomicrobium proavitum]
MKKWLKFILVPLGFLVFVGALALLNNQLKDLSYDDIVNALQAIPSVRIILALLFALSYYLLLGGYDIVAFKYINAKAPLKPKDIFFTCFISNVLGNNTGYSMLFGGSIRYRLYSLHKVSMVDVTKVLFFSSATIWLGLLAVGGLIFTATPVSLEGVTKYAMSTRGIGIFFLLILVAYVGLSAFNSKPRKIFKWEISFPNIKIVAAQILLATADWIIASLTLFMLMPSGEIPYFILLKVFLVAQLLGIISQVPGGMGVFEASIALLLPQAAKHPGVIGGLLAYRAIFYFCPLVIALSMFGFYEIARLVKKFDDKTRIFGKTVSSAVVQVLAVSTFFAGMIAMFSASTPFNVEQIQNFLRLLPVWTKDLSHFLLSVTAASLLFLSRALQLRIKGSYKWTCFLVGFAILLILAIGEPPLVLAAFIILFIALLFAKKYFYRNISILDASLSMWWFSAIGGVFVLVVWTGFFINKQDIFSWIRFDVLYENLFGASDAARFLRATVGLVVIFIIVALEQIFKNYFKKPVVFDENDIKRITYSSDYAYAFDALALGKSYMVNDEKTAFIMYAQSGDSLISLGDPVGGGYSHKSELLWKFKEAADKESVKPAFVGIDHRYKQLYDDIGLDIFNIGQEAKIPLRTFDKNKELLTSMQSVERQAESSGFEYEVVKSADFEKYREIFAQINKTWEQEHGYLRINFIPGKYDESYMKDLDFSIIRKDGKICAFSVFAAAKNKYEMSTGVVRYLKIADDIFPYILTKNILWAKSNGFKWFDLGLAYFPDVSQDADAVRHFAKIFMFAEHFHYDLTKLREFKNKFSPVWHNKYVAVHPDKYIVMFLKNFTALISPPKEKNMRQFLKRFFVR